MTANLPGMPWFEARRVIMGGEQWPMEMPFLFLDQAIFGLITILYLIVLMVLLMLLWDQQQLPSPTTTSPTTMRCLYISLHASSLPIGLINYRTG